MANEPEWLDPGMARIRRRNYWTPGAVAGSVLLGGPTLAGPGAVWAYKSSRLKGHGKTRATLAGIGGGLAFGTATRAAGNLALRTVNPSTFRKATFLHLGGKLAVAGGLGYGMSRLWQRNKQRFGR